MSREGSDTSLLDDKFDELQDDTSDFIAEPMPGFESDAIKQFTTVELADMCRRGEIDISPDYQRSEYGLQYYIHDVLLSNPAKDPVWSDAKQSQLIDSIFRNFYVPPILFSRVQHGRGADKNPIWVLNCVDGKQRLTSITKFLSGDVRASIAVRLSYANFST